MNGNDNVNDNGNYELLNVSTLGGVDHYVLAQ